MERHIIRCKGFGSEPAQKDLQKRTGAKEACEYVWVLKEDGDTHCHQDTANLTDELFRSEYSLCIFDF